MERRVNPDGVWYHGSNMEFAVLKSGSTVTQWKALAQAFSHKPTCLEYDDDGRITHNGTQPGILYILDEPIEIGKDVYPHPRSSMDADVEFLTSRELRVKKIDICTEDPQ